MHDSSESLGLVLHGISLGEKENPWDLKRLLFRGGAATRKNLVDSYIQDGKLGSPLPERLKLVQGAHDVISGKLAGGGSQNTAKTQFICLCNFFGWADEKEHRVDLDSVQAVYIHWTDYLLYRQNVKKDLSPGTTTSQARNVGAILDSILERRTPMIELTRVRNPSGGASARAIESDKQNLTSTFAFGRLLQQICDTVTVSTIRGALPATIPLIHTEQGEISHPATTKKAPSLSMRTRPPLKNIRILAEILMFIAQTGMNLTQACGLTLRKFSYASDIDGYKVRDYKSRRGGEVLFEIFKEYRWHFERYLEWRRTLFPDDPRLFPLVRFGAHEETRPSFRMIEEACKRCGIAWHPASALRSTRINWLLRRSGSEDLTADMAQHAKQTLLSHYEVPSLQRAIGEIARFWQASDPTLSQAIPLLAVAPGACDGDPSAVPYKPERAAEPDCVRPSGCLWCEHHRDIDSFDYVWSLSCFRYLKTLELSRSHPTEGADYSNHPSEYSVSRLSEKLAWFRNSNAARKAWVDEALARIEEGSYHPDWSVLVEAIEESTV